MGKCQLKIARGWSLEFESLLTSSQYLTSCSFLDFTQTQAARILKPSASLILVERGLTFPEKRSLFRVYF